MAVKNQLLVYLKRVKGTWVSGELLSRRLGVSRAAIWKHIRKLKEEGYGIEASPKKGYLLAEISDLLLPEEIRDGLSADVFGRKEIFYYRELDSTNGKAKELAAAGAPEGTVVIAEKQTEGRGRRGRSWFSPSADGIYVSLIIRPDIAPTEASRITLMTAVATAEALHSLTPLEIRIKWPNDILVNGSKIGGILTEISAEMDVVHFIVIGLGLNVNMPLETFPHEIRERATSVFINMGEQFSRVNIVRAYLEWYEKYYEIFKKIGFKPVIQRWKEFSDIVGQQVLVDIMKKKYFGKVVDVDDDGALILQDDQKKLRRIFSGDIILNDPAKTPS